MTLSLRESAIGCELHTAHEVAKLQELRLAHVTNTLNALEEVIGEARARFKARGISVCSPHSGQTSNEVAGFASDVITSNTGTVEEVSVLSSSTHVCVRF